MKNFIVAAILLGFTLGRYHQALAAPTDPWKTLAFLEGTWDANTQGGSAQAQGNGTYSFVPQLKHHVLVRHNGESADCRGPKGFDCEHSDVLLYLPGSSRPAVKGHLFRQRRPCHSLLGLNSRLNHSGLYLGSFAVRAPVPVGLSAKGYGDVR
jgi:hypothetical protein